MFLKEMYDETSIKSVKAFKWLKLLLRCNSSLKVEIFKLNQILEYLSEYVIIFIINLKPQDSVASNHFIINFILNRHFCQDLCFKKCAENLYFICSDNPYHPHSYMWVQRNDIGLPVKKIARKNILCFTFMEDKLGIPC